MNVEHHYVYEAAETDDRNEALGVVVSDDARIVDLVQSYSRQAEDDGGGKYKNHFAAVDGLLVTISSRNHFQGAALRVSEKIKQHRAIGLLKLDGL